MIECLSYKLKLRTLANDRHIVFDMFVLRIESLVNIENEISVN